MSRKPDNFKLVTIKNSKKGKVKPEIDIHYQQETQKVKSHYQCLSTTNREDPEQFTNSIRKEPVHFEPKVYTNIAHANREAQHSPGLSQGKAATNTDKGAEYVTPTPAVTLTPAVLSHRRSMEILKTYIKAKPVVTKQHRNAAGSDTENDTSDFTPASSWRNNTYTRTLSTGMKSSGRPPLQSDVSTQPAMHSVVAVRQSRNHPDTAPSGDGDNVQTLASSGKKDAFRRGSNNKCQLL